MKDDEFEALVKDWDRKIEDVCVSMLTVRDFAGVPLAVDPGELASLYLDLVMRMREIRHDGRWYLAMSEQNFERNS